LAVQCVLYIFQLIPERQYNRNDRLPGSGLLAWLIALTGIGRVGQLAIAGMLRAGSSHASPAADALSPLIVEGM
jgi:hypothetical protein